MRTVLAVGVLLLSLSAPASADETYLPWSEGTRIYWQTDFWPSPAFNAVGMSLDAQIDLRGFMIDLELPWLFGAGTSDECLGCVAPPSGGTQGALGDVAVGMHGTFTPHTGFTIHVGGAVAVPTSFSPFNNNTEAIAVQVWIMRDFVDLQRFAPQAVGVRIPFGVEVTSGPWILRSDLNALILAPVGSGTDVTGATFVLEQTDEVEGRTSFGLCGGLRFQAAFLMYDRLGRNIDSNINPIQTAVGPFVGYAARAGFFARLGLLVGLNSGSDNSVTAASLQARIGYAF